MHPVKKGSSYLKDSDEPLAKKQKTIPDSLSLLKLPPDLIYHILLYADPASIQGIKWTCKYLNDIVDITKNDLYTHFKTVLGVQLDVQKEVEMEKPQDDPRADAKISTQSITEAPQPEVTVQELITRLEEIHTNIIHPKIWNSDATKSMIDFNRRFTNAGVLMEKEPACNHPVIIRILHFLNYFTTQTIPAVVALMVKEGCIKEQVEIVIDEFLTQAFFLLALLGRNQQARETIVKYRGAINLMTSLTQNWTINPNPVKNQRFVNALFALGQVLTSVTEVDDQFKQRVINLNLVPCLFDMLEDTKNDPLFVQYIFFAAGNLTFICDLEKEILAKKGIAEAFFCLEAHKEHVPVISDIVFFLKNMAFGEKGRNKICKQQGVEKIFNILVIHSAYPELVDLSLNLLFDLTFNEDGMNQLCNDFEQRTKFFINLIKKYRDNFAVVKHCVKILTRVYLSPNNQNQRLVNSRRICLIKEGYIDSLMFLHTKYSNNTNDTDKLLLIESIFNRLKFEKCSAFIRYMPDSIFEASFLEEARNNVVVRGGANNANNANANNANNANNAINIVYANANNNDAIDNLELEAPNDNEVRVENAETNANQENLIRNIYSLRALAAHVVVGANMPVPEDTTPADVLAYLDTIRKNESAGNDNVVSKQPEVNNNNAVKAKNNENNANNKIFEKHVFPLRELAGRCIVDNEVIDPNNLTASMKQIIPQDLQDFLNSKRKCALCAKHFFDNCYQVIYPAFFTPLHLRVPMYWVLCSSNCTTKLFKSTPSVSQASIVPIKK